MSGRIKTFWRSIGPGVITGAVDDDPGGIATYTIAGTQHGYATLWMMFFILPFMIALQEMSARIGAISGCGLTGNIKRHYPAWILSLAAIAILVANVFNIGADVYGMAGALNLLVPLNIEFMAIALSILMVIITIKLRYKTIVSIFKWLAFTLFAYAIALGIIHPDWGLILKNTFLPTIHFNKEFLTLLFALVGTTISPYLYFWQASEEAEEVRLQNPRVRICKPRDISELKLHMIDRDTILGMVFSNVISFAIIALAAATLYQNGLGHIETLRDAAQALRPIAGNYAVWLFTIGVLGAGLLSIPILAGSAAYVLAEMFNWKGSLDSTFGHARKFYLTMVISVALGLLVPFIGITPVQALFYSGIVNGAISPILILLIIHMANNSDIVGEHRSRWGIRALGYISFILMTAGTLFVFATL